MRWVLRAAHDALEEGQMELPVEACAKPQDVQEVNDHAR